MLKQTNVIRIMVITTVLVASRAAEVVRSREGMHPPKLSGKPTQEQSQAHQLAIITGSVKDGGSSNIWSKAVI